MKYFLVVALLFMASCSGGADITKLEGVYPGMQCSELEVYFEQNKIPYKEGDNEYEIKLKGDIWEEAEFKCKEGVVSEIEVESKKGEGAKYAKSYIDVQQGLMEIFKGNIITFEEGQKTINFNNGVRLKQDRDEKTSFIKKYKVKIVMTDHGKSIWQKMFPLFPTVGTK